MIKGEFSGKSANCADTQENSSFFLLRRIGQSQSTAEVRIEWEDLTRRTANGQSCQLSFNKDGNPFTPGFIFQSDGDMSEVGGESEEVMFQQKVASYVGKTPFLLQPKPLSDYCSVCRERFNDYNSHIKHPFHIKNSQTSPCQPLLQQLINSFQRSANAARRRLHTSGEGRKRRKLNESATAGGEQASTDLSQSLFFNELKPCRPSRS